jgi:putative endonuclease
MESEDYALDYLEQHKLKLIARNFRCRRGEIDLVMADHDCLVFIEVRFRKSIAYGSAVESVTRQKQQRIIHTAEVFMQQHPLPYSSYRFDVVAINTSQSQNEIMWIKDAFQLS